MKPHKRFLTALLAIAVAGMFLATFGCGGAKPPTHEAEYDVIIIGAGMGGLSAGAHLASKGLKVLVLEQHHKVGGCTTNFTRGDFTFETALHEMAGGGPGRADRALYLLHKLCGVDEYVELYELPDFYRSVYPDGLDVTLGNTWEDWDNTLKEEWPEEAEGIDTFHTLCSSVMGDILDLKNLFRLHGSKAFFTKMKVPFKQKTFMEWKDKTLQELMDECFTDEGIKAVVSQLWVYYGAPVPYETSLLAMCATDGYLTDGIWHVMGTSQALSNGYAQLIEDLGSDVKTGTLVTEIIIEDGIARGVVTEYGDVYTSRYVVCNTDPYQMIYDLIGEENLPGDYVEEVAGMKPANSLFGVYMGLNIDLAALGYDDTEILVNTSLDSVVVHDNMMAADFANGASTITIYSNYGDPIYAPPGKSVVVLHAYSDYDVWPKDQDEYLAMKDEKAWELINLAATVIPELANPAYIEEMEIITPVTLNEFTMNEGGIIYGFYMSPEQWEKIPNNTPIDNIFIAGNWSQAWHGVSATQVNGWRAARLILDIEGIE
jgi:prolycopene isomerase